MENPNLLINLWKIHPNNCIKSTIQLYKCIKLVVNLIVYCSKIIKINLDNFDKFGPLHTFLYITKLNIPLKVPPFTRVSHIWWTWNCDELEIDTASPNGKLTSRLSATVASPPPSIAWATAAITGTTQSITFVKISQSKVMGQNLGRDYFFYLASRAYTMAK